MTRLTETPLARLAIDPERITAVGWMMAVLGTVVAVGVYVVLVMGLRRGTADRRASDDSAIGRRLIVGGGVVLPVVVITIVFGVSLAAMSEGTEPIDPLRIDVTGHQFWWEVAYPDHDFVTANEIHVPVGRPVEITLRSSDVIHSFWVPDLGGKMDALPDYPNKLVFEADKPGEHRGVCAEFCGLAHAHMGLLVVAESPQTFEAWIQHQSSDAAAATSPAPSPAAGRGGEIFAAADCGSCHTVRGTTFQGDRAPDLTHVAGRRILAAGAIEPDRLRAWLIDPHQFKPGTAMKPVELDEDRLNDLVAYLEELE